MWRGLRVRYSPTPLPQTEKGDKGRFFPLPGKKVAISPPLPGSESSSESGRPISADAHVASGQPGRCRVEAPPVRETTTILLVEDDPDTLRAVARHLIRMGHRVHTASTGAGALQEAFRCGPDLTLALIDIRLPDMDGTEVWVRLNRQLMGIRGLFISGYDPGEFPDLKLDRKEILFLPKPFEASQLDKAIQDLLASR
ncbi:MAG: response regulator [Gemmatimonadales bacterium]|nr:MAG: response regulator [Gemmatimonadales bacterium]